MVKNQFEAPSLHQFFNDKDIYVTGGLNGTVKIRTPNGNYKSKTRKAVNVVIFKPNVGEQFNIVVATLGNGVIQIDGINMSIQNRVCASGENGDDVSQITSSQKSIELRRE